MSKSAPTTGIREHVGQQMNKIAVLTKQQLISIINREPLKTGIWFTGTNLKNCSASAVGQVFRNLLAKNTDLYATSCWIYPSIAPSRGPVDLQGVSIRRLTVAAAVDAALQQKEFLRALSLVFETSNHRGRIIRSPKHPVKKKLVAFIKKNFPPTLEVNLGTLPARKTTKLKESEWLKL